MISADLRTGFGTLEAQPGLLQRIYSFVFACQRRRALHDLDRLATGHLINRSLDAQLHQRLRQYSACALGCGDLLC